MRQTLLKSFLLLCSLIVGSVVWADSETITFGELGLENGVQYSDPFGTNISVTFGGSGGNDGKYYTTGSGIRTYGNGTITITAKGNTITGIVTTFSGESYAPASDNVWSSDGTGEGTSGVSASWEGSATEVVMKRPSGSGHWRLQTITVTYTTGGDVTPTCDAPTFSPAAGTYTTAQNVTISTTTEDATIYYTVDGTDPTTESTQYTSAITVSETTTIKAIAVKADYNNSSVASATYKIVKIEHAGTSEDPYTVADAINAIDLNTGVTGVYATGIVSQIVSAFNSTYGNISYNISADGTTEGLQLQAYRGKGKDGASFTSADDVKVGDIVVVYGNLTKFGSTYEFAQDNQLYSLERPVITTPTLNVSKTSLTGFTYAEGCGPSVAQTFDLTGENLTGDVTLSVDNKYYEISVSETSDYANSITRPKSEFGSKTIYVRLRAGLGVAESYSSTITITSEDAEDKTVTLGGNVTEYVPDYATLPFVFNGGRSDIENTDGLTQKGLSTDYNTKTTKLKFDGTGDYLILKINETAATLAFDVKGNSFSGGTFTVQTSTDGINYRDLNTYTELGDTQTEAFALAPEVRFVKWVYTEKSNGNVGLGNIKVVDWTETATVGEAKYATYVPNQDVIFSSGVEAYIGALNGKYVKLTAVKAVAKGTPVILKNTGRYVLAPARADELDDISSNVLKASTEATVADGTQYILAMPEGEPIGFYKASGIIPPGKAYLVVPAEAGVKAFYFEADDATAINEVNGQCSMVNGQSIYNLAGQRINKLQKGINIVGGKKILK